MEPKHNTREHGGTTGHNNVTVQFLSDIKVTLHDGVVSGAVDTSSFQTKVRRSEQSLGGSESFVTDGNNLTIRQFVRLLDGRGLRGGLHFLLKVQGNVTQLLLDVTDDFSLGGGGESVTTLTQDAHQVVSQVSTGQVDSQDTVRQRETGVDWHNVGDTVTRVQDDTGGSTRGVQRQNGADRHVEGWNVEGFEHDAGHLLSVGLRVLWSFGQQNWVFLWSHSQFVVEGVVPDLLHVVPVVDDTVLDRVSQSENTSLGLSFVTNVTVLLAQADHDTAVSWSTDDRGEDGTRSVVTGVTGFTHTRTVIDN